jgi:hypothetical protein
VRNAAELHDRDISQIAYMVEDRGDDPDGHNGTGSLRQGLPRRSE